MHTDLGARRKSMLLIVFLVVFIDLLGFGMVLPLMPVYAREFTGGLAPGQQTAVLVSLMTSFSVMQLVFAPLWGRLSDRIGRRPVLLVSLTGSTIFYGLFGMATLWRSLPWMFIARIGAGIAGATIPTAQACIADSTPLEKRARGMALIGAAFGLGFTLGPLLGALAILRAGDTGLSPWPGYTAAVLSGISLLIAIVRLPESLDPQRQPEARRHLDFASFREAFFIPSVRVLLVTGFLSVLALANFESTISFTVADALNAARPGSPTVVRSSPEILMFFAFIGLVQSLVQGILVRRLATRMSEGLLAKIGGCLSILGFIFLALAAQSDWHRLVLLGLASAVEVSGIGFLLPAIQSLLSRRSDPAKQGGILGLGESVSTMARIAGMGVGVTLYQRMTTLPFWMAAGVMGAVLVLASIAAARGHDWSDGQES